MREHDQDQDQDQRQVCTDCQKKGACLLRSSKRTVEAATVGHPRSRNSECYRPEVVQGGDEGAEKLGQLRSARRVVVLQQLHLGRDVDDDELRLLGGVECLPEVKLLRPAPYEQRFVVNEDISGPASIRRACM